MQPVEVPAGRLLLRPFRPSDAPAVLAACQDAAIQRWTTVPSPYSEGDAVAFVTEIAPAEWAADTGTPFAISGAATGRLLGSIGVRRVDRRHGSAEVGYWVAAAARGRGVATEALRAVTSWSFAALGLGRLELLHAVGNRASCRVASRAGFRPEGSAARSRGGERRARRCRDPWSAGGRRPHRLSAGQGAQPDGQIQKKA